MVLPILSLLVVSFVLSFVLTLAMKHLAPRIGFVDKPGHRKIHHNPKPLGGGVAIFLGVVMPLLLATAGAWVIRDAGRYTPYLGGVRLKTPLAAGIMLAMLGMHVLGLRDDKRAMGPYSKLILQLGITAALVASFKE